MCRPRQSVHMKGSYLDKDPQELLDFRVFGGSRVSPSSSPEITEGGVPTLPKGRRGQAFLETPRADVPPYTNRSLRILVSPMTIPIKDCEYKREHPNPKPQTLNPKSQTLSPKPQSLNPKP